MSTPFFSVIIPTRSRLQELRGCLDGLARLEYSKDRFEVIVVNDGSTALSVADLAEYKGRLDLIAMDQAWAGAAAARNSGTRRARGSYLAFTDDDCTVAADWLQALENALLAHPTALIGGHTVNAVPENVYATASLMLVDYLYLYYHDGTGHGPRFFTSNNMCVRADALRAIGGFEKSFTGAAGEDRDVCDRWIAEGYELHYAADAVVYHRNRTTLPSFTRQHLNYGRGAWIFHQARARRARNRVKIEPLSFYSRLVAFPLTAGRTSQTLVLCALLAWTQVLNAAGYFLERMRSRT